MASSLPLEERRIVVTRPQGQAASMMESLRQLGAVPLLFPVIRIESLERIPGLEAAIRNLERYDWAIFTSVNGVRIFWDWMELLRAPSEGLAAMQVAAIGPATADSLRNEGMTDIFVPDDYVGEALGEQVPDVAGKRVLLPRAAGSRPALPEILTRRGAAVDEFAIYRASRGEPGAEVLSQINEGVDVITFTSPSTVRQFSAILRENGINPTELPDSPAVACIGPITAKAARQAGYRVQVVAQDYTVEGLVGALIEFYGKREATR